MSSHIIPQDSYNHIQDVACGCNPIVTIVEGEEVCYHSEIVDIIPLKNMEEVKEFFKKLDSKQTNLDSEFKQIIDKLMGSNLDITPKEFWENGGTFELINPMLQAGLLTLSKAMDIIVYHTYGKTTDEKAEEFFKKHKIKYEQSNNK